MTAEQAANLLYAKVRESPWFMSIGCGQHENAPSIFLYTKSQPRKGDLEFLANGWMGFPVVVRRMGQPRAIDVFFQPPHHDTHGAWMA